MIESLTRAESTVVPDVRESAPTSRPVERLAFRFAFAYLVLYNAPFPFDVLPVVGDVVVAAYSWLWDGIVPWAGRHVLHLGYDITVRPNGSGDTTYNYVQVFCYLVLALVSTLVWTALDRERGDSERLRQWLRVYVRGAVAYAMIAYGAVKAIPAQFASLTLDRLLQPFGDASPMGLLWTFMGASDLYTAFGGVAELLGGLLLLVPRTTTLGALVSAGVLSNVVMLNFGYDVPVKLYSSHLLAMAIFLLAPDLRRLADFFVLNRATVPVEHRPLFERAWLRRAAAVVWTVLMAYFVVFELYGAYKDRSEWATRAEAPLYGIWTVEEFEVDGEARPPVRGDETRWQRIVFDFPGIVAVQLANDSRVRYRFELDEEAGTLTLSSRQDPTRENVFTVVRDEERMAWEGEMDGRRLRVSLRRTEPPEFRLTKERFHWVHENTPNR